MIWQTKSPSVHSLHHHARNPILLFCLFFLFNPAESTIAANGTEKLTAQQRGLSGAAAQKTDSLSQIELRKPIERKFTGDEIHSYQVVLAPAHFTRLTVNQRGTDVSISVFGTDGQLLTKHDVTSSGEEESISLLAENSITYRLDVKANPGGDRGSYVITMEELRAATEHDRPRVAAERMFSAAMQLLAEQKEEPRRRAIEKFEQARALSQAGNDPDGQAKALYMIAYIHVLLREIQKAIEVSERGLPLAQAAGNRKTQAYLLDTIGSAHDALGDKKKSLEYFNRALSLRDSSDRLGMVNTLNNIGIAHSWMGNWEKAIDHFTQVSTLLGELGNRRREATLLNNLCVIHMNIGEYRKGLQFCNQSISIRRDLKDLSGTATTISNMGNNYSHLGEYQKALDSYLEALAIHKLHGESDGEAVVLNNIGWVYGILGEYEKANDYYTQSLNIIRAKGDNHAMATALGNVGVNYARQNEFKKALDVHLQALPLTRATNDPSAEAIALSNIGNSYVNLGDKQKGLDFYTKSLELHRKAGNPNRLATTLRNIGDLHTQIGEYQKALDYFNEALTISRAIGDPNGEGGTLSMFAKLERKRGNLREALKLIEQALTTVESLRINVKSAHLRTSFFASVRKYYEFNISVLMDLHKQHPAEGFDAAALQASERSRARSLLELLKEARAEIRQGVDPLLIERESKLRSTIADRAVRHTRLLSGKYTEAEKVAAEKELGDLTTEYEQLQAQIRTTSPRYAALTSPVPLDLKKIQRDVLDADTLLLEYSLGEEKSFVWAVTSSSIKSIELPKRAEIEQLSHRLYDALIARNQSLPNESPTQRSRRLEQADAAYPTAAARLSQMVLGPVASELKNKRLLIVSEGMLQYVPFAALPVPSMMKSAAGNQTSALSTSKQIMRSDLRPLIEDHEIVNLPSASVLGLLRQDTINRKVPGKTLAVFADPVFSESDERLMSRNRKSVVGNNSSVLNDVHRSATESGLSSLVRLRFSRVEADQITKLAADKLKLKAVDFAANRALATSEELGQYRIVHFATHGLINNQYPELSGVVLSLVDPAGQPQDGFLRLYDIYNLKLTADLVVLSACQTALGKEIRGEGIVGLTRGFMYAGSPRVVASLWQTDDRASAELMQRFYSLMLGEELRPAAALRAAQISMLREKRWQSPRYWAAFTHQGEWK